MSKENLVNSVFKAIRGKSLAKLEEILEHLSPEMRKEVLEAKENGLTLLEQATGCYYDEEIVEYLIKQGADPNKMLHNECFLLHITILKGYLASAKALINNGADINVKNQGEDALADMKFSNTLNGRTALHFAIQLYNDYKSGIELHREGKAEFDEKEKIGYRKKIDDDYETKLNEIKELEKKEKKIFEVELRKARDEADSKTSCRLQKELYATHNPKMEMFSNQREEAENSRKLEANKYEDLEKNAKKYDEYLAKTDQAIEFVKLLVSKDADLTAKDRGGKTPLDIAKKRSDSQELIEFLEPVHDLKKGIN